jgi:hypothetical protein
MATLAALGCAALPHIPTECEALPSIRPALPHIPTECEALPSIRPALPHIPTECEALPSIRPALPHIPTEWRGSAESFGRYSAERSHQ